MGRGCNFPPKGHGRTGRFACSARESTKKEDKNKKEVTKNARNYKTKGHRETS